MKRASTEYQEPVARYRHLKMHSTLVSVCVWGVLKCQKISQYLSLKCASLSHTVDYREAVSKLRSVDVNAVSGTLKLYFRELPLPLIPSEQFKELSDALGEPLTYQNAKLPQSTITQAT